MSLATSAAVRAVLRGTMWSTSQSEESVKGSPQIAHLKPYRAATRFCMSSVTLLRMLDVFIGGVGGADRTIRSGGAGMETASAMPGSSPSSLLLKFAPTPSTQLRHGSLKSS